MWRFVNCLGVGILCFTSLVATADGGFYLSAQAGPSRVKFDETILPQVGDKATNTVGVYASAGYRTPFNLVLEVGGGYGENLDAFGSTFDNYELSELRASIGFVIPFGEHFRLVPKAGRYRWRLGAEEGQFLNNGPELSTAIHDTEGHLQLDGEVPLLDWLALDFSYFYADTAFGTVRSYRAGVQFEF